MMLVVSRVARDGDGDGGSGEMRVVVAWTRLSEGGGRRKRRVAASGMGDRIDQVMRSKFGFSRKCPPEKFFGGGGVVVAGSGGGWPEVGREMGEYVC
ncbi:hypothetical protein Tco_0982608 [Tanacetum coccineum]